MRCKRFILPINPIASSRQILSFLVTILVIFCISLDSYADNQFKKIDSLETCLVEAKNNEDRFSALLLLNNSYIYYDFQKSLIIANQALLLAENLDDKSKQIKALFCFSDTYRHLKEHHKSLKYLYQALELSEGLRNEKLEGNLFYKLAREKCNIGALDEAYAHNHKTFELAIEIGDSTLLMLSSDVFGRIFFEKEEYGKALAYYQQSLEIAQKLDLEIDIIYAIINIGNVYVAMKEYDLALQKLNNSIRLLEEIHTIYGEILQGKIFYDIANLYRSKGDYKTANDYYDRSIGVASSFKRKTEVVLNYKAKQEVYDIIDDHELSYKYLKLYTALKDSIFDEEANNKAKIIKTSNEIDEENRVLQKEKQVKNKEIKAQKIKIYVLLGILFILIILSYLVYRQLKLKKKLHSSEKEKLINQSEKEKELNRRIESEKKLSEEENIRLQEVLLFKEKELVTTTLHITQKNEALYEIRKKLEKYLQTVSESKYKTPIYEINKMINQNANIDKDWGRFKMHFEKVHSDFFNKLHNDFPALTQNDLRLCAYLKMSISTKDISIMLNIETESVVTAKKRLKKKFNLPKEIRLSNFINQY